jgi:ribosomal-protein-serine acetyltransferase
MLVDRNRQHLREWLPWVDATRSPADTRNFIEQSYLQFQQGTAINYGIRVDGNLAGVVGFHGFDRIHRVTSLGYWLAEDHCGQGIMLKCVAHCIDAAFREEKMNRLYIRCAVKNARSRQIPIKLGLSHEGIQRQAEFLYDHFVDLDIYSVLAEEWDSSLLGRL